MNERWRVALAGLIAALAVPLLAFDTPGTAEGIETAGREATAGAQVAPVEESSQDDPSALATAPVVEVVVIEQAVSPDISLLAARAGNWGAARSKAVADGRVEVRPPAPSNTDLGLLPTVADDASEDPTGDPIAEAPTPSDEEKDADGSAEASVPDEPADEEPLADSPEPAAAPAPDGDADPEEAVEGPAAPSIPIVPAAPVQVDGRVPPPNGGPTAAQWDALRNCESTHNYAAINNTGTYRGAYQFSQQTWDWVSGIHWPHLVGVDPAEAQPAWQDIMAYTLFAMRGWDQWPICGQHLL